MLDAKSRETLVADLVLFAKHIGKKVSWGYEFDYCSRDQTAYFFFLHGDEVPESVANPILEEARRHDFDTSDFFVRLAYTPSNVYSFELTDSIGITDKSYTFAEFYTSSEHDELLVALFNVYRKKADECVTEDLEYIANAFNKYSIK